MASSRPGTITREDERLLEDVTPGLMDNVNIADSPLLAELKMRRAITRVQEEDIKVCYIATIVFITKILIRLFARTMCSLYSVPNFNFSKL